ncbi:hypothetical protein C8R42DRAFT_723225 [Lentinula raphanica]|nr:hypothetical protein C8R42DRAFT_723225 [Lentinula raphanica]
MLILSERDSAQFPLRMMLEQSRGAAEKIKTFVLLLPINPYKPIHFRNYYYSWSHIQSSNSHLGARHTLPMSVALGNSSAALGPFLATNSKFLSVPLVMLFQHAIWTHNMDQDQTFNGRELVRPSKFEKLIDPNSIHRRLLLRAMGYCNQPPTYHYPPPSDPPIPVYRTVVFPSSAAAGAKPRISLESYSETKAVHCRCFRRAWRVQTKQEIEERFITCVKLVVNCVVQQSMTAQEALKPHLKAHPKSLILILLPSAIPSSTASHSQKYQEASNDAAASGAGGRGLASLEQSNGDNPWRGTLQPRIGVTLIWRLYARNRTVRRVCSSIDGLDSSLPWLEDAPVTSDLSSDSQHRSTVPDLRPARYPDSYNSTVPSSNSFVPSHTCRGPTNLLQLLESHSTLIDPITCFFGVAIRIQIVFTFLAA